MAEDPNDWEWQVGLAPHEWNAAEDPVLTQVVLGVVNSQTIHARTALVASNAFPRSYEILSLAHLLH